MSCLHPLKGFVIGVNPESGAKKIKVRSYDTEFVETGRGSWTEDFVEIPCGKCIACRLAYSRAWATRCMCELPYHSSSYFITLTYDNDFLRQRCFSESIDPDTGEWIESFTLVRKDFTDFMKRLRISLERSGKNSQISYFACGEYGGQTQRPHFHAIIFGLELDDLVRYKVNFSGQPLYNSEFLSKVWPYGFVVIGDVTFDSCAYVARYVLKKQKGKHSTGFYVSNGIDPEFAAMSLRPAIGRRYFEDHLYEIYEYDFLTGLNCGRKLRPPKYFDNLMSEYDPSFMEKVKAYRMSIASNLDDLKSMQTDLDKLERLAVEEENILARISMLPRKEI